MNKYVLLTGLVFLAACAEEEAMGPVYDTAGTERRTIEVAVPGHLGAAQAAAAQIGVLKVGLVQSGLVEKRDCSNAKSACRVTGSGRNADSVGSGASTA